MLNFNKNKITFGHWSLLVLFIQIYGMVKTSINLSHLLEHFKQECFLLILRNSIEITACK